MYAGTSIPSMNIRGKRNRARTRFITEPAATIRALRLRGLPENDLFSSSSFTSSSGFSPTIFTYPPKGIREMQYSVSFLFTLMSLGPKPSENLSTPTLAHFATAKCPSSCMNISTPRTSRNEITVVIYIFPFVMMDTAHSLPRRLASTTSSTVAAAPGTCLSRTSQSTLCISVNLNTPLRNISTQNSSAAFRAEGAVPPISIALYARERHGNLLGSTLRNSNFRSEEHTSELQSQSNL